MWQEVKRNFILQQGFEEPAPAVCPRQYSALHFQPRTVFVWIVAGILFHSPPVFYLLCAVLWWSALLPKLNPFDALYNLTFGGNRLTAFYLTPAPAPRRTAQAMAGMFALACGLLLHFGLSTAAYVFGRNLPSCRGGTPFGRVLPRFFCISPVGRQRSLRAPNAALGDARGARFVGKLATGQ